ncbi:hypothetical protein DMENIID0001_021600 [Sergentomyia squamirostris]
MTLNPLIVIFYALCSYLLAEVAPLPVTSQPLASNPDHLAWEAWLTVDSRNPFNTDMTRKITPKSIFIAPNFRNESLPCPPGFKIDHRGQCIRIVSIDPNDLLANRLQSILASTNLQTDDEDIYDYDAYDTSGPYQVNLPVSLDANSKLEQSEEAKRTMEGLEENTEILKGESSTIQETVEEHDETTTMSEEETKISTDMSLASTEDATEDITEVTTMENFETIPLLELSSKLYDTATEHPHMKSENDNLTESSSNQITTQETLTKTERESLLDIVDEEESEDDFGGNSTLKADLERDDLVLDVSSTVSEEITTMANEPEATEVFTQSFTTSLASQPTTTVHRLMEATRPTEEKRVVIITDKFKPSRKEAVQIVTPIPNIFIATSTVANEDTTQYVGDLLGVVDESEDQKKIREMVIQEEQKNAAMEKIDTNNRFVYHHLRNPTTPPPTTTTAEAEIEVHSTTPPALTTVPTKIHIRSTTEVSPNKIRPVSQSRTTQKPDNRIRFPTQDDEDDPDEFKGDLIRFPGPSSHRFVPNMNRLIPESLSRKPPTPVQNDAPTGRIVGGSSNRKPSWYPPTWGNRNSTTTKQQKPVLMRFWSRMPLIRDASFSGRRSLGHRENSKSPSEDLYKEVTSQDVYRVIGSRQKKHSN